MYNTSVRQNMWEGTNTEGIKKRTNANSLSFLQLTPVLINTLGGCCKTFYPLLNSKSVSHPVDTPHCEPYSTSTAYYSDALFLYRNLVPPSILHCVPPRLPRIPAVTLHCGGNRRGPWYWPSFCRGPRVTEALAVPMFTRCWALRGPRGPTASNFVGNVLHKPRKESAFLSLYANKCGNLTTQTERKIETFLTTEAANLFPTQLESAFYVVVAPSHCSKDANVLFIFPLWIPISGEQGHRVRHRMENGAIAYCDKS